MIKWFKGLFKKKEDDLVKFLKEGIEKEEKLALFQDERLSEMSEKNRNSVMGYGARAAYFESLGKTEAYRETLRKVYVLYNKIKE
jgi:hypothetical protein